MCWPHETRLEEVTMRREREYNHLADNARKRGGEEQDAQLKAQWEIMATTYVQLADQSKKIDDTGTSYDLLDRTRTVWPSNSH